MATTQRQGSIAHLRLPDDMKVGLKVRAAQNRRTMNAEILHLIDAGLAAENEKAADERQLADR